MWCVSSLSKCVQMSNDDTQCNVGQAKHIMENYGKIFHDMILFVLHS